MLLIDLIPSDIWAEVVLLGILDVRDLPGVAKVYHDGGATAPPPPVLPAGAVFVAKRVLSDEEINALATLGVPVTLLDELHHEPAQVKKLCRWWRCRRSYDFQIGCCPCFCLNECYDGGDDDDDDACCTCTSPPVGVWTRNGKPHRDGDRPAMIWSSGRLEYWQDGKLHRGRDRPAVIYFTKQNASSAASVGTPRTVREWYVRGERHREGDRPAVENDNGDRAWWVHGERHRDRGRPAVITHDGFHREWFVRGERHRSGNRPAIEAHYGTQEWWQHGKLHRDRDLPAVEKPNGDRKWYVRGELHRANNQPAVERADGMGNKEWWRNGKRHRDDGGPAAEIVSPNARREWWVDGKRHRSDGLPAIEWANGAKQVWCNGERGPST